MTVTVLLPEITAPNALAEAEDEIGAPAPHAKAEAEIQDGLLPDAVLVTNDRAFGAVPVLRIEDWTAA